MTRRYMQANPDCGSGHHSSMHTEVLDSDKEAEDVGACNYSPPCLEAKPASPEDEDELRGLLLELRGKLP